MKITANDAVNDYQRFLTIFKDQWTIGTTCFVRINSDIIFIACQLIPVNNLHKPMSFKHNRLEIFGIRYFQNTCKDFVLNVEFPHNTLGANKQLSWKRYIFSRVAKNCSAYLTNYAQATHKAFIHFSRAFYRGPSPELNVRQ